MDFQDIEWDEVDAAFASADSAEKAYKALSLSHENYGPTWGCDELTDAHQAGMVATGEAMAHARDYLRRLLPELNSTEEVESLIDSARKAGVRHTGSLWRYYSALM